MARLPVVFYNPLSLVGAGVAVFNVGFMVFLLVVEAFSRRAHPYADLIVWIVLPAFVLCGVALFLFGIWRERRRQRQGLVGERRFAILDINDPKHRAAAMFVLAGLALLTLLYGFAGYKAYEFSESTAFCGTMCHSVMGPELRAHSRSAHAEIACADCHVGPGAKQFVLAKLKGTRQLIHLVLDRVPRPIPTPVVDLRPSQEVCENCHGPKTRIHRQLESRDFFLSDEKNTRKTINLLFRAGAPPDGQRPSKMHWHYSTTQEIVYAAGDEKRATIPWIRVKRLDGKERVYRLADKKMSDAEAAAAGTRTMDCTDCHNRVGHPYRPPREILNALLGAKLVDPGLPEIKRVAVEALDAEYASRDQALRGIDKSIREYYQKSHPAVASDKEAAIASAIRALQAAYGNNYDPHMKVSWKNFPSNQGHMSSPGCFRCHDGNHRSDDGVVLSADCNTCHLLVGRVDEPRAAKADRAVLELMKNPHPAEIGDAWKQAPCHSCHGG